MNITTKKKMLTNILAWVKRRKTARLKQGNDLWLRGYWCMCDETMVYIEKKLDAADAEIKRRKG